MLKEFLLSTQLQIFHALEFHFLLFQGTFSLNIELLGECATKCLAYAKALHYKEIEFSNHVTLEVLESLIR